MVLRHVTAPAAAAGLIGNGWLTARHIEWARRGRVRIAPMGIPAVNGNSFVTAGFVPGS